MEQHFTATAYVMQEGRALLHFHPKLEKWLPPGGHLEPNETPSEAALREVLEETGLEVELIPQENIRIDKWNAKSLPRPYMCLLEEIPSYRDQPAHRHIDMIYLAKPVAGSLPESGEFKWFTWEEVEALASDHEIFEETKETLRHLLAGVLA